MEDPTLLAKIETPVLEEASIADTCQSVTLSMGVGNQLNFGAVINEI